MELGGRSPVSQPICLFLPTSSLSKKHSPAPYQRHGESDLLEELTDKHNPRIFFCSTSFGDEYFVHQKANVMYFYRIDLYPERKSDLSLRTHMFLKRFFGSEHQLPDWAQRVEKQYTGKNTITKSKGSFFAKVAVRLFNEAIEEHYDDIRTLDDWIFEDYRRLAPNPMNPEFKPPTYFKNFDLTLQGDSVRRRYDQLLISIAEKTPFLEYPNGDIYNDKTDQEVLYAKEYELDTTPRGNGFIADFLLDAQRETLCHFAEHLPKQEPRPALEIDYQIDE